MYTMTNKGRSIVWMNELLRTNCVNTDFTFSDLSWLTHTRPAPRLWFVFQTRAVRVWHPSHCGGEAWTEGAMRRGRSTSSVTAPKRSQSPSAGWVTCTDAILLISSLFNRRLYRHYRRNWTFTHAFIHGCPHRMPSLHKFYPPMYLSSHSESLPQFSNTPIPHRPHQWWRL